MTDALPGDAPRPFVLLDGVSAAEPDHLTAWRRFGSAPMWQGLEAAAQAAALHQRFLAGFSCHAFLLSVDECRFPTDALDGLMVFRAVLLGRSVSLGIGLAPYDDTFRRDMLEPRYRRLFQWLTQNAPSANVSMKG